MVAIAELPHFVPEYRLLAALLSLFAVPFPVAAKLTRTPSREFDTSSFD